VTVEAALVLGVLVLVTLAAVGAVLTVVAAVRCTDAAREAARLAARGEPERGRAVAGRLAPSGAAVEITTSGDEILVVVTAAPVRPLPLQVGGRAVAVAEPESGPVPGPAGDEEPPAAGSGGADAVPGPNPSGAGREAGAGLLILSGTGLRRPRRRRRIARRATRRAPRRQAVGTGTNPAPRRPRDDAHAARRAVGCAPGGVGRGRPGVPADDSGVATVWGAAVAALLLAIAAVGVDVGSAVLARHRAEAAADLSALAAATDAALGERSACPRAEAVAAAMGSTVRRCTLDGWDAVAEVTVTRAFSLFGGSEAHARARAGPVERPDGGL